MDAIQPERAYRRIRAGILSFDLVPGEKLSERGLESLTDASRTPIRAALMRLENEGLTRRDGRTWQVSPIDIAEIRAVMEYREVIEGALAARVVERATDDELDALRTIARAHEHRDDEESGLRDGGDFHGSLALLSRNEFFADGMRDALTRLSRTRWLEVRTPASRAQAREEHLAIVDALLARDAAEASALVVAHGRGTRDRLLAYLAEERRRLRGRGFAIIESSPAEGFTSVGD